MSATATGEYIRQKNCFLVDGLFFLSFNTAVNYLLAAYGVTATEACRWLNGLYREGQRRQNPEPGEGGTDK